MPRQRKQKTKASYKSLIWQQGKPEALKLDFMSSAYKTQRFTKIDISIIQSLTNCSGPIAICCSSLIEYLHDCTRQHQGLYWHSSEMFRINCLPCCTVKQIKSYLNILLKYQILYREFGPSKISMWSLNRERVESLRVQYMRHMDDVPAELRARIQPDPA